MYCRLRHRIRPGPGIRFLQRRVSDRGRGRRRFGIVGGEHCGRRGREREVGQSCLEFRTHDARVPLRARARWHAGADGPGAVCPRSRIVRGDSRRGNAATPRARASAPPTDRVSLSAALATLVAPTALSPPVTGPHNRFKPFLGAFVDARLSCRECGPEPPLRARTGRDSQVIVHEREHVRAALLHRYLWRSPGRRRALICAVLLGALPRTAATQELFADSPAVR